LWNSLPDKYLKVAEKMKTFQEFMLVVEGLDMKTFKANRRTLKRREASADAKKRGHVGKEWYNSGRTYSPDEAKRSRAKMDDEERRTRHRSAVDPDNEDDNNYSADKTKNPKKLRKQKAMGELGESYFDEMIRNPESRKKLRDIEDREVRKGDKSKGENPRSKYSTEKGKLAGHLLRGPESTGSKGNPVRSRGGTNAPADERVGRGPHRAGNAKYWAGNAGPNRDRGAGNKAARRVGKSVPNTRPED